MSAEVFIYSGEGGFVPQDVVHARIDSSVTSIPTGAFICRKKLHEVELCEGLVEIGTHSFGYCDHSITRINIPTSLRRINYYAFSRSLRTPIRLHDGIERIGAYAFSDCVFTNFRVPSLITMIPCSMLRGCTTTFSLEMPEIVFEVGGNAFYYCSCLRNVAFPPNAVFGDYTFFQVYGSESFTDLQQLFGSEREIIRELQHRFDRLPIHIIVYYHSYHQGVLHILIATINMRSGLNIWILLAMNKIV